MINIEETERISESILDGPHADATLRVWEKCRTNCDWRSGYVLLTRIQIAAKARIKPATVSRAMVLLERYGAIIRHKDGTRAVYQVNPIVGWASGNNNNPTRGMSKLQGYMIGATRLMRQTEEDLKNRPELSAS